MSGPVSPVDVTAPREVAGPAGTEITEGRRTVVGGIPVTRSLPRARRRTVGAWCFVDHFGPAAVDREGGTEASMRVGPHPHIGLHTVTWVLDGEVLHRDSLGTEQLIKPGQLNLMTAGRGVAHAEESGAPAPGRTPGPLHGLQLWVAQPEATRHGPPAFEHHPSLPEAGGRARWRPPSSSGNWPASAPPPGPTRRWWAPTWSHRGPATLPLDPAFEHALLALDGPFAVDGATGRPGRLRSTCRRAGESALAPGPGAHGAARALLLGGVPFAEPVLMWWNFVARTEEEMVEARSGLGGGRRPVRPGRDAPGPHPRSAAPVGSARNAAGAEVVERSMTTTALQPNVDIRRADDRFKTSIGWLDSKHSFSFSRHWDPDNTHHGLLLVNNDDIVLPGTGFETHPHRDMEIVTWVLQGSLVHQDSTGTAGVIYPGLAQRMSAGTGILHSEKNDSWTLAGGPHHDEPVHFVQMWVVPDEGGITPGYEQLEIDDELLRGGLVTVASGMDRHDGALGHPHPQPLRRPPRRPARRRPDASSCPRRPTCTCSCPGGRSTSKAPASSARATPSASPPPAARRWRPSSRPRSSCGRCTRAWRPDGAPLIVRRRRGAPSGPGR